MEEAAGSAIVRFAKGIGWLVLNLWDDILRMLPFTDESRRSRKGRNRRSGIKS